MQLSPRYDADPIIQFEGSASAIGQPLLRQRRRLAEELQELSAEQWSSPSRCDGWRVQDVVSHLVTTDQFWNLSLLSGLDGEPTKLLAGFDPKATPAALADATRDQPTADILRAYLDATGAFCATVEALDETQWTAVAEAPPGHVTVTTLAHHALWDAWIHERDVLQPLGIDQPELDDEVVAALRYAAALSPGFAVQAGAGTPATLVVESTEPSARFVVRIDDRVIVTDATDRAGGGADELSVDETFFLRGNSVELLEALSVRSPLPVAVPDEHRWLFDGLRVVFEATPG